jgi:hypothetical protein
MRAQLKRSESALLFFSFPFLLVMRGGEGNSSARAAPAIIRQGLAAREVEKSFDRMTRRS